MQFLCLILDWLLFGPLILVESPIGSFLFNFWLQLCD
jgi:hypothetical protein